MEKKAKGVVAKGILSVAVVFVFASLILMQNYWQQPLGAAPNVNWENVNGRGTGVSTTLSQNETAIRLNEINKCSSHWPEEEMRSCFKENIDGEYFSNCEDNLGSLQCYPRLLKEKLVVCARVTKGKSICEQEVSMTIGKYTKDKRICDIFVGINKDYCLFGFYTDAYSNLGYKIKSGAISINTICTGIINTPLRDECYSDLTQVSGRGMLNLCNKIVNVTKRDLCYFTQINPDRNKMTDCKLIKGQSMRSVCISRFANSEKPGVLLCSNIGFGQDDDFWGLEFGIWKYLGEKMGLSMFNTAKDQCWYDLALNSNPQRKSFCDEIKRDDLRIECLSKFTAPIPVSSQ